MIQDQSRAGYFGGSDTAKVVSANRKTDSWKKWWDEKLGGKKTFYGNAYTIAGNVYEHSILTAIDKSINFDRQIIIDSPRMLLRVNYDGNLDNAIYEIKTHKNDKTFDITNNYWMQAQVEMFAWKYAHEHNRTDSEFVPVQKLEEFYIVSYALDPEEVSQAQNVDEEEAYAGRLPIHEDRLIYHKVKYDKSWIKGEYLPALKELSKALRKGKYPA